MLDDVLALTEVLPTRRLAAGEVLFVVGESSSAVVILVEGDLVIESGGVVIARHAAPGTFIGEIGALLGQDAARPCPRPRPTP